MGRDSILGTIKNQQGSFEFTHNGIVIMISNEPMEDMFKNSTPLVERFFCVELKLVSVEPNLLLTQIIIKHIPSILNWSFSLTPGALTSLVTTRHSNTMMSLESSEVGQWLLEHAAYEQNYKSVTKHLYEHFKDYVLTQGKPTSLTRSRFVAAVTSLGNANFKKFHQNTLLK